MLKINCASVKKSREKVPHHPRCSGKLNLGTLPAIHRPCKQKSIAMHLYNTAARLGRNFGHQTSDNKTPQTRSILTEPRNHSGVSNKTSARSIASAHTLNNHSHNDKPADNYISLFLSPDTRKPGLKISDKGLRAHFPFVQSSLKLNPKPERRTRLLPSTAASRSNSGPRLEQP